MKLNKREMESLRNGKMVVFMYEQVGDKSPYTKTIYGLNHFTSVWNEMVRTLCEYAEVYTIKDGRVIKEGLTRKQIDERI